MAFLDLNPADFSQFPDLTFGDRERRPRVICAVDGRDKSGKSDFTYDSPDPIGVISFDFGDEDVIQKFQAGEVGGVPRVIAVNDFHWQVPEELRGVKGENLATWVNTNVWQPSFRLYKAMLESGQFRTIVIDKATEWWQICRLSVFGRLATNRQDLQTEANARWREVVRMANTSEYPVNLMLIHEQREEWISKNVQGKEPGSAEEKWFKSGAWVRDGNEKVPFLIQHGLQCRYVPAQRHPVSNNIVYGSKFEVEVQVSRGRPEHVGRIFVTGEQNSKTLELERKAGWLDVMTALRPEIDLADWGHATIR